MQTTPGPSRYQATARPGWGLWMFVLVAGILGATTVSWWLSPRAGGYALALVLAGVGTARLVLPTRAVDGLATRSRVLDAAMSLGLAGVLAIVSFLLPDWGPIS